MAMRRDGIPNLVDASGKAQRLERIPVNDRQTSEGELQRLLHECPQLLPVDEIDPSFGPLLPIGMEIGTAAGPIDNLYISPQGLLTIVEAKLWRNPQARREVIGQILDYAKELTHWSYDDLDARTKEATGKTLFQLVGSSETIDEARFVDSTSRNLRTGRFLLLIVGDGIREEMERLARFLQDSPQLRFTLALVELQMYRLDDRRLVIPAIVARTVEITRAVVQVKSSAAADVSVTLDIADDVQEDVARRRDTIASDEFFDELRASNDPESSNVARRLYDEFGQDSRFELAWGSASYQIKLRDPDDASRRFLMLVVTRGGTAYASNLTDQLAKAGLPFEWGTQYFRETAELLGRPIRPKDGTWSGARLQDIGRHYADLKAIIQRFADHVYSARAGTT